MKIDTEIRHVTKPGANLFLELGFSAEEARLFHEASQRKIDDTISSVTIDRPVETPGRGSEPAKPAIR